MSFSERLCSGFALAATIAKDAGADKARLGLAASSAEALTTTARELASLPKAERRARVRALMSPTTLLAPTHMSGAIVPPLRALALLHGQPAQPASSSAEISARPGYTPDPRLLALLQRIAGRNGFHSREIDEGSWRG